MATRVNTATDTAQEAQERYFRVTEVVWYWVALASTIVSASFFDGQARLEFFVGQWPPTFLLFGLFHTLLRPSL